MIRHKLLVSVGLGLFSTLLMVKGDKAVADDEAAEQVEPLARGPVHEAFAQPLEEGNVKDGPMAPKAPPEPIEEQPPEVKPEGDSVQWIPGYWQWDDERGEFLWVSGVWRDPPPNRKWVPGSWRDVDGEWRWTPGFWMPENQDELRYLPPPPATVEEGPSVPAPGEDYSYVPGCWMYRDTRYLWRPGYWLQCRPGWLWQPAHYINSPAGCIFVAGGWDHPWERRGLLFAPVRFGGGYRPRLWCPSFTVSLDFMRGALFVRSGHRHYWYGDYFNAQYRRSGFTPWVDHRVARGASDPAFGYYRSLSGGRNWERDLRTQYTDRSEGRGERLPRTLIQQNTIVKNIATERKNVDLSRVTALRPLAQSSRPESKLVPIQRDERDRQRQGVTQFREAATQRASAEKQLIVKKEAPSKVNAAPRSVPLNLPKFERRGSDGPKLESPRNLPPSFTRPSTEQRPAPKVEPKIERQPQQRFNPPKVETPQPKIERPAPKVEQPKFVQPREIPKIERPTPKVEQPKFVQPRVEQRPAPKLSPPPQPKPSPPPQPKPAPQQQFRPAPQPSRPVQQAKPVPQQARPAPQQARPAPQQARPAPQQARPAPQQARPAPQQARPAPQQARPAPAAKPQQQAPSRPAQSKPQGGKPKR